MRRRKTNARAPSAPPSPTLPSTVADDGNISEKKGTDPRLRPFIVAMANAIIKDMLREQQEKAK